jgi:hypothetical protein
MLQSPLLQSFPIQQFPISMVSILHAHQAIVITMVIAQAAMVLASTYALASLATSVQLANGTSPSSIPLNLKSLTAYTNSTVLFQVP